MDQFTSLASALKDCFDKPLSDLPTGLRQRIGKGIPGWDQLSEFHRRSAAMRWDRENDPARPGFASLWRFLEGWFDRSIHDLPANLRARVEFDLLGIPWDQLSEEQRQSAARQWDYQNDPDTELERERWWKLLESKRKIEQHIETWQLVSAPTAGELAQKEARLAELAHERDSIDEQFCIGCPEGETPTQRRERLTKRRNEEKAKGTRNFNEVVAAEEGVSTGRLKQLVPSTREQGNSPWPALAPRSGQTSPNAKKSKY